MHPFFWIGMAVAGIYLWVMEEKAESFFEGAAANRPPERKPGTKTSKTDTEEPKGEK